MLGNIDSFFSNEECDDIVNFCEKEGIVINHNASVKNLWDNRKIYDNEFKERILKRYKEVFATKNNLPFDVNLITIDKMHLSLTRYYDGRFLEMHRDTSSDLTTVIVLTDNFSDGRFVLAESKAEIENNKLDNSFIFNIDKGDGITFDGHNIYHGVMPVSIGFRKSLNIWVKSDDFKILIDNKEISIKSKKTFL